MGMFEMIESPVIKPLVGDNPFLGISHLSQSRIRARENDLTNAKYDAEIVKAAVENGAQGFMFSSSETSLSIIRVLGQERISDKISFYAIVPYAYEYVRASTQIGMQGVAKRVMTEIIKSRNLKAASFGMLGLLRLDPKSFLKAYLSYEISKIRSAIGQRAKLNSVLLHETLTDMGLALNLDWLFLIFTEFTKGLGVTPGFVTYDLPYLVDRFEKWGIDFGEIGITAAFNAVGFQMSPSRDECERALKQISESEVTAMSIFAGGYIKPAEAIKYISELPNLRNVVAGVSKQGQAQETFTLISERLCKKTTSK